MKKSYLLNQEEESSSGYYFKDVFEFEKNFKKNKLKTEIKKNKNINLIKNNSKLLKFIKEQQIKFCSVLFYLKTDFNFKNIINLKIKNIFSYLDYYNKINFEKIKKIKDQNIYRNLNSLIIQINIKNTKPKIVVINKDKCFTNITAGIIFKKLNMKIKKLKKTEKMLNLMLKSIYSNIIRFIYFKKVIIHIKGTKSNIFKAVSLVNNSFKNKNVFLIYSPKIKYGLTKFKKLKSIKRRLKKKFIKLLKN